MTTAQTLVGQDFGIYQIETLLNSIDIVDVYQATDTLYERAVRLRVLRGEFAKDRQFVQQFVSAGRNSMRLRHKNIVAVMDAGQVNGCAYIAVESIQTESLTTYVGRQSSPLPEAAVQRLLQQVALGLQYAHNEGFVHGRLNPNVIRVNGDARVLIGDFELESVWSSQSISNQTIWRQIVNPHFLAPEQVGGVESLGREVDIFSLGSIAYWLVTGIYPFVGANALAIMQQIAMGIPAHPSTLASSISHELEQTILHALEKKPQDRIRSAGEFLAGLTGNHVWEPELQHHSDLVQITTESSLPEFDSVPFEEEDVTPIPIQFSTVRGMNVDKREHGEKATPWYADRSAAGVAVFVVGAALVLLVLVSLLQSASMLMERIVEGGGSAGVVVVLPTVTPTPGGPISNARVASADRQPQSNRTMASEDVEIERAASQTQDVRDPLVGKIESVATVERVSTRALRMARAENSSGASNDDSNMEAGEAVGDRRIAATESHVESGRADALPVAKVVTTPTRTPQLTATPVASATPTAVATSTATPTPIDTPTSTHTPQPSPTRSATTRPTASATVTQSPVGAEQLSATSLFADLTSNPTQGITGSDPAPSSNDTPQFTGRIAFTLWNPHSDRPDVFVWYADTGVRSVAIANLRQPDFGPGGNMVANAEGGGYDNIVLTGRYGENPWVVSEHPEDAHPHWSADGKRVVFDSAHMGDRQHRIYLQSDLTQRSELPPMMYDAWELFGRYPIFLNDDRIAFHGCNYWDTGSICGIHVVDVHGGKPTTATGWPGDIPTDNLGGEIIFMSDRNGNWDVFRMSADGTDLRQLTDSAANDGLATVAPEGDYVAFLSDRSGKWAVYAMSVNGGKAHLLFNLDGQFGRGDYEWLQERLSWGR